MRPPPLLTPQTCAKSKPARNQTNLPTTTTTKNTRSLHQSSRLVAVTINRRRRKQRRLVGAYEQVLYITPMTLPEYDISVDELNVALSYSHKKKEFGKGDGDNNSGVKTPSNKNNKNNNIENKNDKTSNNTNNNKKNDAKPASKKEEGGSVVATNNNGGGGVSGGGGGSKGTAKRDALRANEHRVQALWEEQGTFEVNPDTSKESFMVTFPYPYSNGNLHIGHAFSMTKAIFRAQYERHQGKNVLFPFAFHCTGMPIQAVSFTCLHVFTNWFTDYCTAYYQTKRQMQVDLTHPHNCVFSSLGKNPLCFHFYSICVLY